MDFQIKNVKKRQRRKLHNFKGVNPKRGHNNYKFIHTQNTSTKVHKANVNEHKDRNEQKYYIVGDFNTLFTSFNRSFRQKINK